MRILKFVPYYPPHIWWLESHVAQWSEIRVRQWYGDVMIVTGEYGQEQQGGSIYTHNGVDIAIIPSKELIAWYPLPAFWTKSFWRMRKQLKNYKADMVHTHTRFFLFTIMGGIFAKRYHIPRVHIEHGVDFVKLAARWKTMCAWLYDQTLWRRVFYAADNIVGISEACKRFVHRFTKKPVTVLHRGMDVDFARLQDIIQHRLSTSAPEIYHIFFVWRLVALKWVDYLLHACALLQQQWYSNFDLCIIGEWDHKKTLQILCHELWLDAYVKFAWKLEKEQILYTSLPGAHVLVNPSFQEWLPTSVLEWLLTGCVVVASDVWGTAEISSKDDLILIKPGNASLLADALLKAMKEYTTRRWLSYASLVDEFDWSHILKKYDAAFTWMHF